MVLYLLVFYYVFFNTINKKRRLERFHRTIRSILDVGSLDVEELYKQSLMNFKIINQTFLFLKPTSYIDILEQIIYYYNSCSDSHFKSVFRDNKNDEVRNACLKLYTYIVDAAPFSNLPETQATLLKNIKDAMLKGNIELGKVALKQLTEELIDSERQLEKQERINKITVILSIVGMLLTIYFGIASLL